MSDKELTLEEIAEAVRKFIEHELLYRRKGNDYAQKLKKSGFGLRIMLNFVEEEKPIFCVIDHLTASYRKIFTALFNFSDYDISIIKKWRIYPSENLRSAPNAGNYLLQKFKKTAEEMLKSAAGRHYAHLLKKYGTGPSPIYCAHSLNVIS